MTLESVEQIVATRRPLYEGSTQFKHWRFSQEQLAQIRVALNATAVAVIEKALETDSPGSSSNVQFLTPDEELTLVKLYLGKISQLCGHFGFPEEVEATAVSYLKRFYLKNTVMDWHPKNVMLTALFLATKTTNHQISLEAYTSHIPKTVPSDVLDLEFLVAQSLNFEFNVWHAHRALWGIYLDVQCLPGVATDSLQDVYRIAVKHMRESRLTDAELIYTPSQIALAAISLASRELALQWAHSKNAVNALAAIGAIEDMIRTRGSDPDVEAVREIDKRLRLCKNPEKVIGSKAYNAKKEDGETKAREKRVRKEETRRSSDGGDPFGDELSSRASIEADTSLDDDD